MCCDKCGKETGSFRATDKFGNTLCFSCITLVKENYKDGFRSAVKTKDPFILLCRKLGKIHNNQHLGFQIAFSPKGKRAFTNGHILLSEADSVTKNPNVVNLDTLKDLGKVGYPNITKVTSLKIDGDVVDIPEEFYRCLKSFDPKNREAAFVFVRKAGIHVRDASIIGMTLDYGGADTSGMKLNIVLDAAYLFVLKPGRICMGKLSSEACRYENCAAKGAEDLKHVVVMPTRVVENG